MTHLGLGSSLEDPWGPSRGGSGDVIFLGDSVVLLLGSLGNPVPIRAPKTLPAGPILIIRLTCLGGRSASFPSRRESCSGNAAFPRQNCLGGHLLRVNCFLPGREVAQLPGNCSLPGKEVEQWPERMELFVGDKDFLLPEKEGEVLLGGVNAFPGGKGSAPTCLLGLLATWGRLLLLLEDQVIFPSFLFTKFWNFLICLFLTLLNLDSPTLSMKPWHSLSLSVEMIDAT